MGFLLKVGDGAKIDLAEKNLKQVEFFSSSPKNSNARASDFGVTLKVWGKMNFSLDAQASDATIEIAEWAKLPSSDPQCYRDITVFVVASGHVVREINFKNAFIMEYSEELDDESGVGTFFVHFKQKKDMNDNIKLGSGYELKDKK